MITITPKGDLDPFAFQAAPFSIDRPWSHIQILGGRQGIVFDADGDVMGTFDLALTADVKVIRREGIIATRTSPDGATVHVTSRAPIALGPSSQGDGDTGDYDDDPDY